jgi:hypothetical protein
MTRTAGSRADRSGESLCLGFAIASRRASFSMTVCRLSYYVEGLTRLNLSIEPLQGQSNPGANIAAMRAGSRMPWLAIHDSVWLTRSSPAGPPRSWRHPGRAEGGLGLGQSRDGLRPVAALRQETRSNQES